MVSEIPPPDGTESEWTIVGERIRVARESSGISVRELARRIGVSPSHVSNVERGLASFSVRALYSVVSHLDISMDSLFEDAKWGASHENSPPARSGSSDAPQPQRTRLDESGIVLRKGDRPTIHLGSRRWERLTSSSPLARGGIFGGPLRTRGGQRGTPRLPAPPVARVGRPLFKVTSTFRSDTTKPSSRRATRFRSRRTCPTASGTSQTKRLWRSGSSSMRGRWTRAILTNRTLPACSGRPATCSYRPVM